uniref:N-terminal kinase-like protein n=1 Tax=Aceria tosichella TaxID=561515 RepID=A0A6G1S5E8_9ACAR
MWLLPWSVNSDFYSQYEINDQVSGFSEKSIWSLFNAKRKSTHEAVSIFRFDIRDPTSPSVDRAKQSLKRIKTLRHPSILKYVDSCENEKSICIVTENVTPLVDYLEKASDEFNVTQREFSIAFGLLSVAKGLSFMNNDCQLNHNNINIYSIFVNSSGVWKIGGLECICSVDDKPPPRHECLDEKYTPPEILDPAKARHPGGKFAVDSWGMGCLVWECFNKPLTPSSSVKVVGKMPKTLSKHYNRLVQTSPKHRVSPMDFIKSCNDDDECKFFKSPLLDTILYLEEIQLVKESSEKAKFFNSLESELESFPSDICKNKILPDLINAFEYGDAGSPILNPIFKIGKMLSEEEYQSRLVPCIIKLYTYKDRATRSKLLQQLDSYVGYLAQNVINDQIFPQVLQGFMDSNVMIREQTVKAILKLAPKLTSHNLNDELLKHLSRLITRDEEGGIRANTTICLGNIGKLFNSETQRTILLPLFLRVMRDPFPPTRHAAVAAVRVNESLFPNKDCAMKIMPSLCPLCIDPDPNVRRLASKTLRLLVERLEEHGEKEATKVIEQQSLTKSSNENPDAVAKFASTRITKNANSIKNDLKSLSIKDG